MDFCIKRYSYGSYKPAYLMSEGTRLPMIEQKSFEATSDAVVAGFIMPDHDATITVMMEYDPQLPPNPNQSGWDELSGACSQASLPRLSEVFRLWWKILSFFPHSVTI